MQYTSLRMSPGTSTLTSRQMWLARAVGAARQVATDNTASGIQGFIRRSFSIGAWQVLGTRE